MKIPLADLKKSFDTYFSALIDRILEPYPEEYHYLKSYILEGGKQVRPLLFLEACSIWGGTINEQTLHIASGIELIHNFFLIHDDIMDNDEMRRDKLTLHAYFAKGRSETAGRALALVLGDLLYTEALKCISQGASDKTLRIIQEKTLEICSNTANGQILEFTSAKTPTTAETLSFYKKKTAEYSIYFPLIIAAYYTDAEHSHKISLDYLLDFSDNLGIAYQLYDDMSEIIGTKKRMADSDRCGDIMRAKMTPILIDVLPHLSEELKARVEKAYVLQTILSEDDEKEIIAKIHEVGILKDIQVDINDFLLIAGVKMGLLGLDDSEVIQKLIDTYSHDATTSS
ncbi:MAG: polyprenyl synthetase family protein [Candidatus Gracilibacteria bacterium]